MEIVNIAAYKFVGIPEPTAFQPLIKECCDRLALKGTVLLASEGINLFLAGSKEGIEEFLAFLAHDLSFGNKFAQLEIKESLSENQPFGRMIVRIAKEIITMRHPTIVPEAARAPHVEPAKLKVWLDQGFDDDGRPVVMLDTRNGFEVEMGTFSNALAFDIERFSQFPDAIKETISEQADLKDKTIVSFCTGGIRCEKAALYMAEINLPHVYQLHGGILGYFEKVGGAHWQGECFVFDERVALDSSLKPTVHSYPGRPIKD
ncbi:sulfurtransferase [soil metagenome]